MAHEITFDPADPLLARVRAIAMALPGAQEKISHGRPAFFTRKVFAFYAGTTKAEHAAGLHPRRLTVLLEPDERLAMLEQGAIEPAYLAPTAGSPSTSRGPTGIWWPSSSTPRTA